MSNEPPGPEDQETASAGRTSERSFLKDFALSLPEKKATAKKKKTLREYKQ
ncbi:MAG: hypothetical protein HGB21_11925 [Nitrospirae bacterium]|nr:hypothetical protein [Nitrospirota bacterium]NTW66993.1 hypothetical protein [Nitrospirota bacterium]